MKYACLLYLDAAAASGEDLRRRLAALADASGGTVLEPAVTATSVRWRNGALTIAAGPADRAGDLAAVIVLGAANLDAALAAAARFAEPGVRVEVRPVRSLERRGPKRVARSKVVPLRAYD